jgi:hypothetical protein
MQEMLETHPIFPVHYMSLVDEMKVNCIKGVLPEIMGILPKTHYNTRRTLVKEEQNFVQLQTTHYSPPTQTVKPQQQFFF